MSRYIEPGYIIVGKMGKLLVAPFDLENYKLLSTPVVAIDDVEGDVGSGISYFAISLKGNIIYIEGARNQAMHIVSVDSNGKTEILPVEENPYMLPRISPDNKKIVLNVGSQTTSRDVWMYDFDTKLLRRMTFGMNGLDPHWSNKSNGIYFFDLSQKMIELVYLSLDNGSRKVIKEFNSSTALTLMSVSANDEYILLNEMDNSTRWNIAILNLKTKEMKPIAFPGRVWGGSFSPDGNYITYVSDVTDVQEIYVMDTNDNSLKWQVSNKSGFSPRWSKDGKKLFYINNNGRLMMVPIKYKPTFTPGNPVEFLDVSQMYFPSDNSDNYDVAPDGEHFVFIKSSGAQSQLKSFNMIYNWTAELDKIFKK
jgi:Tol biopolymer transport system component